MKALEEIILLLLPLIKDFMQSLHNSKIRKLKLEIKNAVSAEEKLEAARKIAEYRYNK